MDNALQTLTARLLAHRYLPRNDVLARRALTDDHFRQLLDERLAAVGLQLLENPYAEYIALGLVADQTRAVFEAGDVWLSNNMGLPRDAIALLVVVWALIILPKRERQITRQEKDAAEQSDFFGSAKPMPMGETVSAAISEDALVADFGKQLGGSTRVRQFNLPLLARLGFIIRKNKMIHEGPLLDLLLDYSRLAPRIIDGALADLFAEVGHALPESQAEASFGAATLGDET